MVRFNENSTTDDVLNGLDLTGKRVLVTGVSAGLGVETARSLASRGACVVGTARDLAKAKSAIEPVLGDVRNGGSIDLVELDLASLTNIRTRADALLADGRLFDVIINNAGVAHPPLGHTADGFETQFGTNHLGHFVFTNRTAPLIAPGGRVVIVASAAHRFSDVDLEDPNYEHTTYDPFTSYGRSKTACILFGVEFDRRHKDRGVRATSVHPGVIKTELSRHVDDALFDQMIEGINAERASSGKSLFRYKTVPEGAATSVWAGFVAEADAIGGRYCENCHVANIVDGPLDPADEGLYSYAVDPIRAKALWKKSEELVGERF
jgi:NAD(P)-dependent dehydrogenase (short-subunit alcohol dehydrogenase family)